MSKTSASEPRLWVRVLTPKGGRIGPGMIALLKAVRAEGSIAAAARSLNMSYRRAWKLIEAAGESLGAPVLETSVGGADKGGAVLTEAGARLVEVYDRIEDAANAAAAPDLAALFEEVSGRS